MTSIPMGGFGGQPQQPRQPQQPQGGFGGGFQPTRQRFNPMPQQQGFGGFGGGFGGFGGGFGGFGGGFGGFGGFGGYGMPQQQQGFGGFGGFGMPQQQQGFGGFGGGFNPGVNGFPGPQQMQPMVQPPAPQQQLGQIAPQQQNSPARQSFEQFIASGGPRGAGAGFFNAMQGGQQMQPMVQPTPSQQQAEQAIPQLSPARQYIKAMQQRQQQRMGEISGNPYSQQLGQEDPRLQAMRRMQQMKPQVSGPPPGGYNNSGG